MTEPLRCRIHDRHLGRASPPGPRAAIPCRMCGTTTSTSCGRGSPPGCGAQRAWHCVCTHRGSRPQLAPSARWGSRCRISCRRGAVPPLAFYHEPDDLLTRVANRWPLWWRSWIRSKASTARRFISRGSQPPMCSAQTSPIVITMPRRRSTIASNATRSSAAPGGAGPR